MWPTASADKGGDKTEIELPDDNSGKLEISELKAGSSISYSIQNVKDYTITANSDETGFLKIDKTDLGIKITAIAGDDKEHEVSFNFRKNTEDVKNDKKFKVVVKKVTKIKTYDLANIKVNDTQTISVDGVDDKDVTNSVNLVKEKIITEIAKASGLKITDVNVKIFFYLNFDIADKDKSISNDDKDHEGKWNESMSSFSAVKAAKVVAKDNDLIVNGGLNLNLVLKAKA